MFTLMIINKIHWLGVGLSSPPGIIYLNEQRYDLLVWNRSVDKAQSLLKNKIYVNQLDISSLSKKLDRNDLIVSMLPASMHMEIAELAINYKCHLVTSSYHDPQYEKLEQKFIGNDCLFICECGLDPGIDHLLAHKLIQKFEKENYQDIKSIWFESMCGGFPEIPNNFKYKFSWSPLGVLKALNTPANHIENFSEERSDKPYEKINFIEFNNEKFETYPNRNSIPYINEYNLGKYSNILEHFERGTIRLEGWSKAWNEIFKNIEDKIDLANLSKKLWEENQYDNLENDRVLLYVKIRSKNSNNNEIFNKTLYLDESRPIVNSAMSQCVSYTVAFTIECIMNLKNKKGIHRIFHDKKNVDYILNKLNECGIKIRQL
jgi:saccharopine dehydrogenase-like NADP-dependent oxidoreductase